MKLKKIEIFMLKLDLQNPNLIKNCFHKMLIPLAGCSENKSLAVTPERDHGMFSK